MGEVGVESNSKDLGGFAFGGLPRGMMVLSTEIWGWSSEVQRTFTRII